MDKPIIQRCESLHICRVVGSKPIIVNCSFSADHEATGKTIFARHAGTDPKNGSTVSWVTAEAHMTEKIQKERIKDLKRMKNEKKVNKKLGKAEDSIAQINLFGE